MLYKNRNLILYYNIFVSLFLYIYIGLDLFLYKQRYIIIHILGFYMGIFSGCAQNGMGKIDALEGIFMSGVE